MSRALRVLLVEDDSEFISALELVLDSTVQLTAVGRIADVPDRLDFDVVCVDLGLPDGDGVQLIAQLTEPVLRPVRRVLPTLGGFDLSPLLVMLGIALARVLVVAPLRDLGVLLGSWSTSDPTSDLNGDGIVNGADFGLLLGAWGPCP